MAERMHICATANGRVVLVALDDASEDYVIDDGKIIPHGRCLDSALATLGRRGGRQSLKRSTAEALMTGDNARCPALPALAASAQRVLHAELLDEPAVRRNHHAARLGATRRRRARRRSPAHPRTPNGSRGGSMYRIGLSLVSTVENLPRRRPCLRGHRPRRSTRLKLAGLPPIDTAETEVTDRPLSDAGPTRRIANPRAPSVPRSQIDTHTAVRREARSWLCRSPPNRSPLQQRLESIRTRRSRPMSHLFPPPKCKQSGAPD